MSLSQLKDRLQSQSQDGELLLTADNSGTPAFRDLLAPLGRTTGLRVVGANIAQDGDIVRVTGTAELLAISAAVVIEFTEANGQIEFALTISPPSDWRLQYSFPSLPPYIDYGAQKPWERLKPSFFFDLAFDRPCFLVTSTSRHVASHKLDVPRGFYFLALLAPPALLQPLSALIGDRRLPVQGPITLDGARPTLTLNAALPGTITVGSVAIKDLALRAYTALDFRRDDADSGLQLAGTLQIGSNVSAQISGDLAIGQLTALSLRGEFSNLVLPGLGELSALLGGKSIAEALPASLRQAPRIALQAVSLDIDFAQPDVRTVGCQLQIGGDTAWSIVPDLVALQTATLEVAIDSPLHPSQAKATFSLFARTELLNTAIDVYAELPALKAYAGLAPGATIALAVLMKKLAPGAPAFGESLTITRLFLSADPQQKAYRLEAGVTGNWSVPVGSAALGFDALFVFLTLADNAADTAVEVRGIAGIGDARGPIHGRVTAARQWTFDGKLAAADLSMLVNALLPPGARAGFLPRVVVKDLALSVDTGKGAFSVQGASDATWSFQLGGLEAAFAGLVFSSGRDGSDAAVNLQLDAKGTLQKQAVTLSIVRDGAGFAANLKIAKLNLAALIADLVDGVPDGFAKLTLTQVDLLFHGNGAFSLSAAATLNFSAIGRALGITLPGGIPTMKFSRLQMAIDPSTNSWQITAVSDQTLRFPQGSRDAIGLHGIELSVGRKGSAGLNVAMKMTLAGQFELAPGWRLDVPTVQCAYSHTSGWKADGETRLHVPSGTYTFKAGIATGKTAAEFYLQYRGAIDLLHWEGTARANLKGLRIFVLPGTGRGKSEWGMSASGALTVEGLFTVPGNLSVASGGKGRRLTFTTNKPTVKPIVLPFGATKKPTLAPTIDAISLELVTGADKKAEWRASAKAALKIKNRPSFLAAYFPAALQGELRLAPGTLTLDLAVPGGVKPAFPELKLRFADVSIALGRPDLSLQRFSLTFGDDPQLSAYLRAGSLSDFNRLFADAPLLNDSCELALTLSKAPTMRFITSPFKRVKLFTRNNKTYSTVKLGGIGTFDVEVPHLTWANGIWEAGGGLIRRGDINIPLLPVKFLLRLFGLPEPLLKGLPDWVPFHGLDLTSKNLERDLKRLTGKVDAKIFKALLAALRELQRFSGHMPTTFGDYLNFRPPDGFSFTVGSGAGGIHFDFRTTGQPLRLLLPLPFPPGLVGITVRGAAFGAMLGGSLATLELDGHVDIFDLPLLIAAAVKPLDKSLTNRLTAANTLLLIPSAFPLPIPMFFDQLAWDLKSVIGLDVGLHWGYPKPPGGLLMLVGLVGKLAPWLTKSSYLLHKNNPREALPLTLTVGQNFFSLPSYLGGKTLGYRASPLTIDISDKIARVLDGLKTGNLGYIITGVPLRYRGKWIRIGHTELRFGPLKLLEAAWCITTENEYKTEILPDTQAMALLKHADGAAVLRALPRNPDEPALDKGFVILLMAGAGIDYVLSGRCQFGMAMTHGGGFQSGFQWSLTFAAALEIRINGYLHTLENGVEVVGSCGLYFNNKALAVTTAGVTVTSEYFKAFLAIDFDKHLQLKGELLISADGATITGQATWAYARGRKASGIKATATLNREGLTLGFATALFDHAAGISVTLGDPRTTPAAAIELYPSMKMQDQLASGLKALSKDIAASVEKATNEIIDANGEFEKVVTDLNGLKNGVAKQLDAVAAALPGQVRRAVLSAAGKFLARVPKSWGRRAAATAAWNAAKGSVLSEVRKGLAAPIRDMKAIAARLRAADPKTAKAIMLRALNDTLKRYKTYTYTYKKNLGVTTFKYPYTYHMPVSLQKLITDGIAAVGRLEEKKKIVITKENWKAMENRKKAILDDIGKGISKDIEASVIKLRYIRFATRLGLLSATQSELDLGIEYKNKIRQYRVGGDLTSLGGCFKTATNLMIKELA